MGSLHEWKSEIDRLRRKTSDLHKGVSKTSGWIARIDLETGKIISMVAISL